MFVAGVVTSGESYEDAIRRELAKELGVRGVEPTLLFKARYRDPDINWWTCCYEVVWDGPIRHQEEEIAWGRFMPAAELIAKLDDLSFVPDGLVVFRRHSTSQATESRHLCAEHRPAPPSGAGRAAPSLATVIPVSIVTKLRVTVAEMQNMPFYLRVYFRLLSSWVHRSIGMSALGPARERGSSLVPARMLSVS